MYAVDDLLLLLGRAQFKPWGFKNRKIIEKAQRQLLQDRVRCINRTIEINTNTINESRSSLQSLITSQADKDKCRGLIDKVKQDRYSKIKDRQVRKFQILSEKTRKANTRLNNQIIRKVQGRANTSNVDRDREEAQTDNNQNRVQNNKWVINLSKTELTLVQRSMLAKGPNFSISPNNIPNMELITAIQTMCPKLKEDEATELRADINSLLRQATIPKSNLTKGERIGLKELSKDNTRVILIADKGVALLVMDKEDYISKAQELLDQPAYRTITRDPTNKIKAQLITKLRNIKKDNNKIDEGMYRAMYLTSCVPLSFMGYQKSIKLVTPLGQ